MRTGALLAALALASCTPAPISEAPREPGAVTIVSLNPCSDAVLAEVADPAQLLAISHYSHSASSSSMNLALAQQFRATSGSLEEVLALRPDMVVADSFLSPATAQALAAQGIRLERLPIAASVAESRAQVVRLAALAGYPQRGTALVARIDAALTRAAAPPGARPIAAVVWQSGGIVPGPATLIGELLIRTGFRSVSAARGMKQADMLPLEAMVADPPQVIFNAGNPRAQADRLLSHPALAALTGTRRARFDPALLWCGGPTIMRAAEWLSEVRRGFGRAQAGPATGSGPAELVNRSDRKAPLMLSSSKHPRLTRPIT